jgi:hypothetical protein
MQRVILGVGSLVLATYVENVWISNDPMRLERMSFLIKLVVVEMLLMYAFHTSS